MKSFPSFFSLIIVLAAGSAQAQDPVARGHALVAEFCGRCHAIGVKGKSRHSDAPPFRNDMPEFKFSHDDALAVRAYLRVIQQ
jgi:cytochrome c